MRVLLNAYGSYAEPAYCNSTNGCPKSKVSSSVECIAHCPGSQVRLVSESERSIVRNCVNTEYMTCIGLCILSEWASSIDTPVILVGPPIRRAVHCSMRMSGVYFSHLCCTIYRLDLDTSGCSMIFQEDFCERDTERNWLGVWGEQRATWWSRVA